MGIVPRLDTRDPMLGSVAPIARPIEQGNPDVTAPGYTAILGAAFRQDNTVGSMLGYSGPGEVDKATVDPNYDAWKDIQGTKYEAHWPSFYDVFNRSAATQMKNQIDREEADRSTLAAGGWFGLLSDLGASVFDPANLLPGGELVRGAKVGYSIGRSALRVGLAAGVSASAAEAVLQSTQEIRPVSDSAFAIGGSALLGGLIGVGAAAALGRGERRAIARGLDRVVNGAVKDALPENEAAVRQVFSDAGAAAVEQPTLSDLTPAGRLAGAAVKASAWMRLNPIVRNLDSPSPVARYLGVQMYDNPIYLRMHAEGRSPGQAVETLVQEYTQGAVGRAAVEQRAAFNAMRKRGVQMKYDQFRDEVGRAMFRGDVGAEPEISAAAKAWRSHVVEPLKNMAIDTKNLNGNSLLPADVAPETAASYFSRLPNRQKIEAHEPVFRGIVRDWATGQVDEQVSRLTANRDRSLSLIQRELADIELNPAARSEAIGSLSAELDALTKGNPSFVEIDHRLTDLRRKAIAADEGGRPQEAAAARAQVADTAKTAGSAYADYRTARNLATARLTRIRNNIVGRGDQIEELRQKITDAEFANVERLPRLHRRLTILDERMAREGPDAVAGELSDLRTAFAQIQERSDKARERLVAAREAAAGRAAKAGTENTAGTAPPQLPQDFEHVLRDARRRVPADPEKRMAARPVLAMLKEAGGVDPNGPLAGELRAAGATEKNSPFLFRKSGMGAADNFVKQEHPHFYEFQDDGNGYLRQDDIIQAFKDELGGFPLRTEEQRLKIDLASQTSTEVDRAIDELSSMGVVDLKASDEEVLAQISKFQNDREQIARMNAAPLATPESYGAKVPEAVSKRQAELQAKAAGREKLFALAELKRSEDTNRIAAKIGELESADPEAAVKALRELVARRLDEAAGLIEREAFRIQDLAKKIDRADPKHLEARAKELRRRMADINRAYDDRVNIGIGEPGADRQSYVNDIVDNVFNAYTGRIDGQTPRDIVPTSVGPLKERTLHIPEDFAGPGGVKFSDFLEHDAELVWRRYARMMSAEIHMTRKFGSADMKDAFSRLQQDYQSLRDAVTAHPTLTPQQKGGQISKLHKRERRDVRDLSALRDMLRGMYLAKENNTGIARALSVVNLLNYLRSMGGVVLSSLTDVGRPMMTQGLGRYMRDGLLPLITNLRALKISADDAGFGAGVAELIHNSRLATWAEITDPYATRTPFEAFLENTARGFSKANGMVYWNAWMKRISSVIIQKRIVTNAADYGSLKPRERAYMAYVGIDASMAERIAKMFAAHGEDHRGVKVANTTAWEDARAATAYRTAVNMDVNSTIVTKGIGDTPLFAHTPLGRAIVQFQGFALASHQRVFLRGLQEAPSGVLAGMVTSVAVGAFIYYLKSIEVGKQYSDNPGHWMAEGLDRSGLFAILFGINNTIEKATNVGAYRSFEKLFPGSMQGGKATRYVSRSPTSTVMGPTGDFVDTLYRVAIAAPQRTDARGNYTGLNEGDVNSIARLLPFATLPIIKTLMQRGVLPPAREWAMQNNPK